MFTTYAVIAVFAVLLLIAVIIYLSSCFKVLNDINNDIRGIIGYLSRMQKNAESFGDIDKFYVEHFEDINKEFREYKKIYLIWEDFRKSLTIHKDSQIEEIYSSTDASWYFSYQNFTQGMNMSFWQNYGGTFTGLGILGTFLGLTIGLYGIDMTSSDVEVLKAGIAELLSGVQLAFITSLFGIFFAVIYGVFHNYNLKRLRNNINSLALQIEEMFPRRTIEEWLHQNNEEARQQTNALKNIGEDVAQAIYEGFDEHINNGISELSRQIEEKISPLFEKIYEAIDKLNDGGASAVGEIMAERTGSQMEKFSASLEQFTSNIQQSMLSSQQLTTEMNRNVLETLSEMRNILNEGTTELANRQKEAMKENSIAISSLTDSMSKFTDQQQKMLSQSAINNASQMKLATDLFRDTVSKHSEAIDQSYDRMSEFVQSTEGILSRLKEATISLGEVFVPIQQAISILKSCLEQTDKATKQFHTEIALQINKLTAANQRNETSISNLVSGLKEYEKNVEQAWLNYESNFNRVGGELEKATNIITERLQKYNEMMNSGITSALSNFDKSVSNSIALLQGLVEDLQDSIDDLNRKKR